MQKIILRGRRWRVRERDCIAGDARIMGQCNPASRTIDVQPAGRMYLGTTIHEVLHALRPSWREKRVNRLAEELAAALWRLGYRRD